MKQCVIFFILIISSFINQIFGDVYVKGYVRKNGTYVAPHYRSNPDKFPYNNYSYPGNYNYHTVKTATGNPSTYLNKHSNYIYPEVSEVTVSPAKNSCNIRVWAKDTEGKNTATGAVETGYLVGSSQETAKWITKDELADMLTSGSMTLDGAVPDKLPPLRPTGFEKTQADILTTQKNWAQSGLRLVAQCIDLTSGQLLSLTSKYLIIDDPFINSTIASKKQIEEARSATSNMTGAPVATPALPPMPESMKPVPDPEFTKFGYDNYKNFSSKDNGLIGLQQGQYSQIDRLKAQLAERCKQIATPYTAPELPVSDTQALTPVYQSCDPDTQWLYKSLYYWSCASKCWVKIE